MGKIQFLVNFFVDINVGGFKYSVLSVRVDVFFGGGSMGLIFGVQIGKIFFQNKRILYQLLMNDLYFEVK